jgi:hypothetical protein
VNVNHLEYLLRPTPFYPLLRAFLHRKAMRDWQRTHAPPAPHAVKRAIVQEHARRSSLAVFIETGTFFGDMLDAVRPDFRKLYSIELAEGLHRKARLRFADQPEIHLIHGDSGEELARLLNGLAEPALFWLDGHFSGGVTARGKIETPILSELSAIFAHPLREHVVLIDDARLFGVARDYPSLDELRAIGARARPEWTLHVEDDVVRIGLPERLGR